MFTKATIELKSADNADYQPVEQRSSIPDYELIAASDFVSYDYEAQLTGGAFVLSGYTKTVNMFVVVNKDDTNFITLTWQDPTGNANSQKIGPGLFAAIPGANVAADISWTPNTAACQVEFYLIGS